LIERADLENRFIVEEDARDAVIVLAELDFPHA
jgi:hypothetical protein